MNTQLSPDTSVMRSFRSFDDAADLFRALCDRYPDRRVTMTQAKGAWVVWIASSDIQ